MADNEAQQNDNMFRNMPLGEIGSLVSREGFLGAAQGLRRSAQLLEENIAELQQFLNNDDHE